MKDIKDPKKLQDDKKTLSHKAGDAIERVGEKVSKAGAPKAGKEIYKAGNKLEHSEDDK